MNKIRWGLIGCGDIARRRVVNALQNSNNSQLYAAARRNKNKIKEFTTKYHIPCAYDTWEKLLTDKEINAVYIASPVSLHAEQTIKAAEAGKHVLCEKPMALDTDECKKMIDACTLHNVKLGIAYYRHYYPVMRRIKEIIDKKILGIPILAQINAFSKFNPEPSHPRYWLLNKSISGGGPLKDFGCHRIEVFNYLFGQHVEVKSFTENVYLKREVEDTAVVIVKYESAVLGTIFISHAVEIPHDTLAIHFSHGKLYVPVLNDGILEIYTKEGKTIEPLPPHKNLHQPLIEDFIEAVLKNRKCKVSGAAGMDVEEIISAVYGLK